MEFDLQPLQPSLALLREEASEWEWGCVLVHFNTRNYIGTRGGETVSVVSKTDGWRVETDVGSVPLEYWLNGGGNEIT